MKWMTMTPLLIMTLSACSTTTHVDIVDAKYKSNEVQCPITFFKKTKPEGEFKVLAKIESHVQRNIFFGGDAKLEDQSYAELKTKTCSLGGNAVIVDDFVESRAAEFSHVHVWATAIKLL
jgi:hypothetical protein